MGDKNASSGLKLVDVQLDSGKFLSTMVEQVRMLVLKAVAKATKTQVPLPSNGSSIISLAAKKDEPLNAPSAAVSSSATLASFRSALRLSPESGEQTPSLLKARSSALRLNSILQGAKSSDVGAGTALGMRKVRSVRWNTPAQLPSLSAGNALAPVPKKTKTMSQSVAKLKSFKSFGRPHAGDFGSGPRNATFGEYGDRTHLWGRDGRLAHHPVPMMQANQNNFAGFEEPNKNATFDMNRPPMSFAGSRPMSSLPRTATVLENILLKKSTG